MIKAINAMVDWLENVAMTVFMFIATIVAIVQVIARYVFDNSLYWSEETILYSLISMSFVAASMGVRYSAHISVELLTLFAGAKLGRLLNFIAVLLGMLFAFTLIYYGWRLFVNTDNMGQLSPAMQIPVAYIYLIIPVSGVLMFIRYLGVLDNLVRNKKQHTDDELIISAS